MNAVCMGELFMDMFSFDPGIHLDDVKAFIPVPGGAAANVAVQIARLGIPSAFIGKVGKDAFGRRLARTLSREGVDVRGVRYDSNARTTTNFHAVPDEHTIEYLFFRNPGADMLLQPTELDRNLIQSGRAFYFGSLGLIDEPLRSATLAAIQCASDAESMIVFDANYRAPLWKSPEEAAARIEEVLGYVNILKVNETELFLLANRGDGKRETVCESLLSLGPSLIIVTLGAKGSYFHARCGNGDVSGFNVKTVDAIGCGDSFVCALIYRLLAGAHWQEWLTFASLQGTAAFARGGRTGAGMQF
jgi:fructokinase